MFYDKSSRVTKTYPTIPGEDPRNYPSTAEVMVCGGAPKRSFIRANKGHFEKALNYCGRIWINDPGHNRVGTGSNPCFVADCLLPNRYGQQVPVRFSIPPGRLDKGSIMVTMIAPSFATHSFSTSQRLLVRNSGLDTKLEDQCAKFGS
ncbi:hypothetical protein SASPL_113711 [Salvia splendens]|uniref:Uncharacterized protein n=1 Tax=Salvia splendens TaxID=180675 RepID=A0A8X8Y4J6_SALSN|nr:hypothetical protein SASPL_113711 [Salvia splendens]